MTILTYFLLGSVLAFPAPTPTTQQQEPLKWEIDREGNFQVNWKYEENSKSRDGKRFLDQRHVEMIWTAPPEKKKQDRYRTRSQATPFYEIEVTRLKWIYEDEAFRVELHLLPGKSLQTKSSIKRIFATPFYYSKGNPLTRFCRIQKPDPRGTRKREKFDRKIALEFLARRVAALEKLASRRYEVHAERGGQIRITPAGQNYSTSRQGNPNLFGTFFANPSLAWQEISRGAKWNLTGKNNTPFGIHLVAPKAPVLYVGSTRTDEVSFYTKNRGTTDKGKFQFDMDLLFSRKGYLKSCNAVLKLGTLKKSMTFTMKKNRTNSLAGNREQNLEKRLHGEARNRNTEKALVAIDQLASFKTESTLKLLVKLTRDRNTEIRIAALDVLGDLQSPDALPHFQRALKNNHWPVRASAIRALGKLRGKKSIDTLIEQMAKEKGRLQVDISNALGKLTGKALGYGQRHWKEWWNVNRERFQFTDRVAGIAMGGGKTTYYGMPVRSERIIFCIDISGSMGGGMEETRLDQAKTELITVLRALKKDVKVNLIFFESNVEPWQGKMVPLKTYRVKALEKVCSLEARGGTNLYDSLEMAFTDPDVDTIYLLSDGAPSAGKHTASGEILKEIRRKNRSRQIAINTISLGRSDLMKKLAEQNGGVYVQK